MEQEFFEIWDKNSKEYVENGPTLETFLIDSDKALGAVLVLPGGGYRALAQHEAGCIGQAFNEQGFHAFVLKYRIAPNRFPAPQLDVWQAIRIIRKNASKWNVNPDMISVLGFSAGGHLAASSAVLYKELNDFANDKSGYPNALILCYPVISFDVIGHKGSGDNLLGEDADINTRKKYSLENRVDLDTPPTFLWHTATDRSVPVVNSVVFAQELWNRGIPAELHVFPNGPHGYGLGKDIPDVKVWPTLAGNFLKTTVKFEAK